MENCVKECRALFIPVEPENSLSYDKKPVERSPGREGPGRAVPDPGYDEYEAEVQNGPSEPTPAAAQGYVEVVPEPGRE